MQTVDINRVLDRFNEILKTAEEKPWDGRHDWIKSLAREAIKEFSLVEQPKPKRPWWAFWR